MWPKYTCLVLISAYEAEFLWIWSELAISHSDCWETVTSPIISWTTVWQATLLRESTVLSFKNWIWMYFHSISICGVMFVESLQSVLASCLLFRSILVNILAMEVGFFSIPLLVSTSQLFVIDCYHSYLSALYLHYTYPFEKLSLLVILNLVFPSVSEILKSSSWVAFLSSWDLNIHEVHIYIPSHVYHPFYWSLLPPYSSLNSSVSAYSSELHDTHEVGFPTVISCRKH